MDLCLYIWDFIFVINKAVCFKQERKDIFVFEFVIYLEKQDVLKQKDTNKTWSLCSRPDTSHQGRKFYRWQCSEIFTRRGFLSKLGLKDKIKTGPKGTGGGRGAEKKGMEVGILLQKRGWPAWMWSVGKGVMRNVVQQLRWLPFTEGPWLLNWGVCILLYPTLGDTKAFCDHGNDRRKGKRRGWFLCRMSLSGKGTGVATEDQNTS